MAEDGVAREPGETPIVTCKWRETLEKIAMEDQDSGGRGAQLWFPCQMRRNGGGGAALTTTGKRGAKRRSRAKHDRREGERDFTLAD